jgi:predicted transcriptional regulator
MIDPVLKESFDKVRVETNFIKTDLFLLRQELEILKKEFSERNETLYSVLNQLNHQIVDLTDALKTIAQKQIERDLYIKSNTSTTDLQHSNTYPLKNEGIKPYLLSSNGNEGVPTNPQQTHNKPTHNPTHDFMNKFPQVPKPESLNISVKEIVSSMKSDLKKKFKALTRQEFYVFSVLFSLEQELNRALSYKDIAIKANLTESTIRDYIGRLIARGIPIIKEKVNNKEILIKVSEDLRNLASLDHLSTIKRDDFDRF